MDSLISSTLLVAADWTAGVISGSLMDALFPSFDPDRNAIIQGIEGVLQLSLGIIMLRQVSYWLDSTQYADPSAGLIFDAISISFFFVYSGEARLKLDRLGDMFKDTLLDIKRQLGL